MITAKRFHDFSYGHRVYGHENKCANIHGHNGRVHFHVRPRDPSLGELDTVGRVLDFSVIDKLLCQWVERNWDHRFLIWEEDPWAVALPQLDASVVVVPFNPTAENMIRYLADIVAPKQLSSTFCDLFFIELEETRKCSASYLKVKGDQS